MSPSQGLQVHTYITSPIPLSTYYYYRTEKKNTSLKSRHEEEESTQG